MMRRHLTRKWLAIYQRQIQLLGSKQLLHQLHPLRLLHLQHLLLQVLPAVHLLLQALLSYQFQIKRKVKLHQICLLLHLVPRPAIQMDLPMVLEVNLLLLQQQQVRALPLLIIIMVTIRFFRHEICLIFVTKIRNQRKRKRKKVLDTN